MVQMLSPAFADIVEPIRYRRISAHQMSSQSLKHLCATGCDFTCGFRAQLESMPLLVTAFVKLGFHRGDRCRYSHYGDCSSNTCVCCYGNLNGSDKFVFLSATNLELVAGRGVTWHGAPHSVLKILLLNGWVVARDFHALVCFLRHTPILEKLTLQIFEGRGHMVKIEESRSPVEQLLQSEHLKMIEVRCLKVDEWVHKILKIFNTYGITPES